MPLCVICKGLLSSVDARLGFKCCGSCFEDRNERGIDTKCTNCPHIDCHNYSPPLNKDSEDEIGW